jgi:hypothetical protein
VPRLVSVCLVVVSLLASVEAVPSPPANLAVQVFGSLVTLSWTAPPGVITGYRVEAGTAPGLSNVAIVTQGVTTTLSASAPAGTYYVRVKATDPTGESAASNEVVVVVGGGTCQSAPGAPTGLTGSSANLSVTLAWSAASGCAATGYVLHAGSAPGLSNLATLPVGNVLAFSAVAPAGTYYVRVAAVNTFGSSAPSNEVVLVVGAGPGPGPGALPPLGTMTAIIDGVPWSGTITVARIATGNALVVSATQNLGRPDNNTLALSTPAVPGTQLVGGPSVTGAWVLFPSMVSWLAAGPQGSGSVTVSTLTATNATGTFFFTLVGNPGVSPDIRVVTNGAFNARIPTP